MTTSERVPRDVRGYLNPHDVRVTPFHLTDYSPEVVGTAAYISGPVHRQLGTPQCGVNPCDVCRTAARLAIQDVAPAIAAQVINTIHRALGWSAPRTYGGDD